MIFFMILSWFFHDSFMILHDSFMILSSFKLANWNLPRRWSREQDPHKPQNPEDSRGLWWKALIVALFCMPTVSGESDRAAMGFESTWPCWILFVYIHCKIYLGSREVWLWILKTRYDISWYDRYGGTVRWYHGTVYVWYDGTMVE